MKNPKSFLENKQTASPYDDRLSKFIELYMQYAKNKASLKILDIGCGRNVELLTFKRDQDKYYGADFYIDTDANLDGYFQIDLNEDNLAKMVKDEKFDIVFLGEVIEHLFSPDNLLDEIRNILTPDGVLIISTPNLSFYPNRLLFLLGISPLFLENSSKKKLGRWFKFLGQGHDTEGHIRVFTYYALLDLFQLSGYEIVNRLSALSVWNLPGERIFSKIHPSLASTNVFVLKPTRN